jgi:hypothetical protein
LAILCLAATGCFRYVPVAPAAVQPRDEVKVRITDDAAVRLARALGRISSELDGRLEQHPDSLLVSVWIGRDYPGTQFANVEQTFRIAPAELLEVRRRQFSPARTTIVTIGSVAVFALLVHELFQQEDPRIPGDGTVNPPPPSGALFRLPLPLGRND